MIHRLSPRPLVFVLIAAASLAARAQTEPPHPILGIPGSANTGSANSILNNYTETQYTNNFVPRIGPRHWDYGFARAVVAGDTGWSWSKSNPNKVTSTPSMTVFPDTTNYLAQTQAVLVTSGKTMQMPYYLRAGSSTKSMVFEWIAYEKRRQLRTDLNILAPTYMASGSSHATRNQAYARRIAIALLDWACHFPDYVITGKNSPTYINAGTNYVLASDLQRGSDHNGLAHEWADDELFAFDAIYDSPALADLSVEFGFDVRGYITTNLYCNEGDFIVYRVPPEIATDSNLSGPFTVLGLVARVLNRPDYIEWLDRYLSITVREKIHRDGTLSEGMGYSIGYLNENVNAAKNTRDYFLTRPADTAELVAISNRASSYVKTLQYGQGQWRDLALPNGQLPSFGDTPFNTYFTARNAGISDVLPSYGTVVLGTGSGSQAVQLNQNFSGDNNHMRSDTTAFTLWAFNNEMLGNVRYHNGTPGRNFTEQILAYNAVTIDRSDMTSPSANTYGNGDLTLYEPGNNGLAVTEIDGQRAYNNKASRYQRLMLLNTADLTKPYVVDVFRVTGGKTHDYVLHGSIRYDQTYECTFPLVTNNNPYPMLEGSEVWVEPTSSGSTFPYYGFWRNVESNTAPGNFQITYRDTSASNRDLRLWMTDDGTANVYIGRTPVPARANGEPADWFVNGLWRPSSIIRKRIPTGTLEDLFVSVIEPMNNGVATIQSVERLPMSGSALESVGLRITFTDGRVDTYIVNLRNPQVAGASGGSQTVSTADGQYVLNGRVGAHMDRPSGPRTWTVNAADFQYPGRRFITPGTYYSGWIDGETRKMVGGSNDAFITTTPLPLGTALRGKQLSLGFGTLSSGGISTGISELFEIDQVLLTNGQYHVCFTNDHQLEITNGTTSVEQMGPLRRFTTSNSFEIALSSFAVPISAIPDVIIPLNGSSGPLNFNFGNLGNTSGVLLQVLAASSNPTLIPPGGLVIGGSGTSRTITVNPAVGEKGSALITVSVTDGVWTNSTTFTATVNDFALVVSPGSQFVVPGSNTTFTASVSATNGFSDEVIFDVTGMPAGVGAVFDPASIFGPGSSTLNVTTASNTLAGSYPLTLTATSGSLSSTSAVTLVVGSGPPAGLRWDSMASSVWDVGATANWFNFAAGSAAVFTQGSDVLFADTPGVVTAVTLNTTVNPTNVTVDASANNYTISGSGKISGATGLLKKGASTLTSSTANDYTGVTTLRGGMVSVALLANGGAASGIGAAASSSANLVLDGGGLRWTGGASLTVNRGFTITTNGGTLDASPTTAPVNLTISGAVALSGTGARTLTLDGTDQNPLAIGGNVISSVIGNSGGPTAILKKGNNAWNFSAVNTYSGGSIIQNGRLRANATNAFGTGPIVIAEGAQAYLNAGTTFPNAFTIAGPGVPETDGNYGAIRFAANGATVSNTVTLTGDTRVTARGANAAGAVISGRISGNFALEFGNSAGTAGILTLSNPDNDWSGLTTISHGTVKLGAINALPHGAGKGDVLLNGSSATLNALLDLNGISTTLNGLLSSGDESRTIITNGSAVAATLTVGDNNAAGSFGGIIKNGAGTVGLVKTGAGVQTLSGVNTYTGNTVVSNGTLLVDGSLGNTVTVQSNATLGGNGFINGAVTVNSSATLSPGSSIGTLTISNTLTLLGTTFMELEKAEFTNESVSVTNDLVNVTATLTYGGTLSVTNLAGALAAGDSFKLFEAATYSGAFASLTPAAPGAGLLWDTNTLATDGTLRIIASPVSVPVIASFLLSGTDLILGGSNGPANGTYYLRVSTNVALPLAEWSVISTNVFDGSGAFNLTSPISPSTPQSFYILQQ